jgi:carbamoyltransferase
MHILGIWDGHDSGISLLEDDKILFSINEERLSRRKLEIAFPKKSIEYALKYSGVKKEDIDVVAVSTSEFAKTLWRLFPFLKENYYLIRRKKKDYSSLNSLKKNLKYKITELQLDPVSKGISKFVINNILKKLDFKNYKLLFYDHHLCHAASAAFTSGFDKSLVITIDGIGDSLSGTISKFENGKLKRLKTISGKNSFGIFFEHVTNLMNMRELEDEGKVMALANYALKIEDDNNPLLDFFTIEGLNVRAKYGSLKTYKELKKILWKFPSEQFAYMAQRTLEVKITELVKNAVKETGLRKICLCGGTCSNIKVNMLIKNQPEVEDVYVFPHMGDGGLAMGSAMLANYELNGISKYNFKNVYLGPQFSNDYIKTALENRNLENVSYEYIENIERETAKIIYKGNIVLWFQGRMEYGPRALGNRSILALPHSEEIKNELNLIQKKRVWYQPFCPSMLLEDANELLEDLKGTPNKFMTMGYMVRKEKQKLVKGVINIDGTCRPQIMTNSNSRYEKLLSEYKKLSGIGVLLNTSFNLHGEPLICSPEDALSTFSRTPAKYMVLENYLLTKNKQAAEAAF